MLLSFTPSASSLLKKLILISCLLSFGLGFGQVNLSQQNTRDKWRVGGSIGLNFGSDDYFGFSIAPSVGYEFLPQFLGGITAGYQYAKWNNAKQNLFNGGPFLNFYPISALFLRLHYEYYTGRRTYDEPHLSRNIDESALWLGGGYRTGAGRVQLFVGLMYNVLYESDDSLFSSGLRPIAGVSIGI